MGKDKEFERIEPGECEPQSPEDFFRYEGKDPRFHYHWAENNPRRIQQLKREGYEIDPAASSAESAKKVEAQREFLKKTLNDPATSKENAAMAKEIMDRMGNVPVDTTVNIPHHIMMRTSIENRQKRMAARLNTSKKMEDMIQSNVRDLNKALQKSGKGGMKAFKDLFDSIKERQG